MSLAPIPSPHIIFHPLHPDVAPPERATEGSAGYDVRAYLAGREVVVRRGDRTRTTPPLGQDEPLVLAPGEIALVPLGFRARLPAGYEAQVRIRSSMAFRRGLIIPNAPGTIDADYPDEWLVMIGNALEEPVALAHGERIAQVVIARYEVLAWEDGAVDATTRYGGLGSTGER